MNIARLSLVGVLSLGVFTTSACATSLEDAIKNVDIGGFARYRYTHDVKNKKVQNKDVKRGGNHRFQVRTSFRATYDDNFFGVLGLRYDSVDGSGRKNDTTRTTDTFSVDQFYLGYITNGTVITAGKQFLGTYFDEDLVGTGVKIVNNSIEGLTLAAVAFDALEGIDTDQKNGNKNALSYDGELLRIIQDYKATNKANINTNLYGIGMIGAYSPAVFNLWIGVVPHTANLLSGDLKLKFDASKDVALGLQAQYVGSYVDKSIEGLYADSRFYALKADTTFYGFNINGGYINFEVSQKDKNGFVSIENNGKLINPTKILNSAMNASSASNAAGRKYTSQYYNNIKGDNHFWFAGLGYKLDKISVYTNYIYGTGYSYAFNGEATRSEINLGGGYKYSKNLNFSTFFAQAKEKKDSFSNKQDRIRFEAKYSF